MLSDYRRNWHQRSGEHSRTLWICEAFRVVHYVINIQWAEQTPHEASQHSEQDPPQTLPATPGEGADTNPWFKPFIQTNPMALNLSSTVGKEIIFSPLRKGNKIPIGEWSKCHLQHLCWRGQCCQKSWGGKPRLMRFHLANTMNNKSHNYHEDSAPFYCFCYWCFQGQSIYFLFWVKKTSELCSWESYQCEGTHDSLTLDQETERLPKLNTKQE